MGSHNRFTSASPGLEDKRFGDCNLKRAEPHYMGTQ